MEDKKSPHIETDEICPQHIPRWMNINIDDEGNIANFIIKFIDPAISREVSVSYNDFKKYPHSDPLYRNYDWIGLEQSVEAIKKNAMDYADEMLSESSSTTFHDVIYKNIHYYDEDNPDHGIVIEKMSVEKYKDTKDVVRNTENLVETFLLVRELPEECEKLWIYDDILDDIIENDIFDIRMLVLDKVYFVDARSFLNYGTKEKKKVYIDINISPFIVEELDLTNGMFEILENH